MRVVMILSMSAGIFDLVATFIFIIGVVALIMGGASGGQCLEMLGLSFGFFVVPFIGESVVILMLEVRYKIIEILW